MASPNQVSFLLLQIPSVLLFFWAQPSSAQFKPLCITQFALADHACSILPSLEEAPPGMTYDIAEHENGTNNNTNVDNNCRLRDYDDDHEDDDKSKPKHGKDDDHKHCKDDDHKHDKDDDHKHHDRPHKHKHDHANDPDHDRQNIPMAYKNCCKWLEVVDHECVCEALLKLPPFLVKQSHEYTMMIEKACKFNYKCNGV
ncbi:hypothetical protein KFK09_011020 [Dendrobium nobile]|uniref:Bifunctional inhibitor/plant lipid transfer protein/seed storage helical domain-containing protein n=1 Tax=Dendrobium nobile TaxID=94219 RepID=A0A8T3BBH9_DENNO|nr:hypothetical protein KFK09_011020 [Dendrobium nobile]